MGIPIARSTSSAATGNTITDRTIDIYLQTFPGKDAAAGVADVPYTLRRGGVDATPGVARTAADGKLTITYTPGQTVVLGILGSEYNIDIVENLEAVTTWRGRQQRLHMLGYRLGPQGADDHLGQYTERAVLDFQSDQNLVVDGDPGSNTRTRLTNEAGE